MTVERIDNWIIVTLGEFCAFAYAEEGLKQAFKLAYRAVRLKQTAALFR